MIDQDERSNANRDIPEGVQKRPRRVEERQDTYVPSSGPAFVPSPSNLSPVYANARQDLGPGSLEANVLAGANSYGAASHPVSQHYVFNQFSLTKHVGPGKNM